MSDEEQIGYAEAMRELEEILDALEDDDLDVDVLATKVERASALIQLCRNRIGNARIQVEKVVASLDEPTEGVDTLFDDCLLYTSPSPRDRTRSRMPSSA